MPDRPGRKANVFDPFPVDATLPLELEQFLATCPETEALRVFAMVVGQLRQRGIFRTHNHMGDYNERLIEQFFAQQRDLPTLNLTAPATWGYDATVRSGERYNLKSTTTGRIEVPRLKSNDPGKPKERLFDWFVVGCYDDDLELQRLVQVSWEALKGARDKSRTLTCAQLEQLGTLLYPPRKHPMPTHLHG